MEPNFAETLIAKMPDALIHADTMGVIRVWNGGAARSSARRTYATRCDLRRATQRRAIKTAITSKAMRNMAGPISL